jgi:hypothetical protein
MNLFDKSDGALKQCFGSSLSLSLPSWVDVGPLGPGDLPRHPGAVIFSVCGSDTVVKLCKHLGRAVEDVT